MPLGHRCKLEFEFQIVHYSDVIMSAMASQITCVPIVYSAVCSGTDQRKHQSSASLALVRGIHRWPVNSPHKGPVTRKIFPFDDVIMLQDQREWRDWWARKAWRAMQDFRWSVRRSKVSQIKVCISVSTSKRKCHHSDERFVIGCTGSCHNNIFQRRHWQKSIQNDRHFRFNEWRHIIVMAS